jgi:uncharacterized protein (DUF362 family)
MNRREFCRKLAAASGAALLAPLLEACGAPSEVGMPAPAPTQGSAAPPASTSAPEPTARPTGTEAPSPTPQPTPSSTEVSDRARIALVKTTDRADGVRRALDLLGENPVRGVGVLLKPNFNSADAAPGSTHPDVLRALVVALADYGAAGITVGDRSGMGNTRAVMSQKGVFALAEELGFDTLVFDELAAGDWVTQESPDFHWARGFAVPRPLLDAGAVVQTCNLKTHRYGGHFTLSLKNSVGLAAKYVDGGYNYMTELHNSAYQRDMIAEINTAYEPALIVMDGVEAFVDGGPAVGTKVAPGVVLAGTDRVALDAVGVAILRMFGTTPEVSAGPVFEQAQLRRAVELGLGVDGPEKIDLVTGDDASAAYAADVLAQLAATG